MSLFVSQNSAFQAIATCVLVGLFAGLLILVIRLSARVAAPTLSRVSSSLLSPLGALFGLTAAFLAASVWDNHAQAVRAASQEARSLSEAWVIAGNLPDPLRSEVRRGIETYVHEVVTEEWPLMPSLTAFDNPVSNRARDDLLAPIHRLMAAGDSGPPGLMSTAGQLQTAFEARSRRIDIALHRISLVQLGSTVVLGLLLITMVAVVHYQPLGTLIIAVGIVSIAVAVSITTIVAHDNPFYGYMSMTAGDFAHLAEYGATAERGTPR
jgi:hypothetical protein